MNVTIKPALVHEIHPPCSILIELDDYEAQGLQTWQNPMGPLWHHKGLSVRVMRERKPKSPKDIAEQTLLDTGYMPRNHPELTNSIAKAIQEAEERGKSGKSPDVP